MKTSSKFLILAAVTSMAWPMSCARVSAENLERRNLSEFSLVEKEMSSGKSLHLRARVSGYTTHSLGPAQLKTIDSQLQVRIPTTGSQFIKACGHIDLFIPLPASIKEVLFGDNNQQIWPVDTLASPISSAELNAESIALAHYKIDFPLSNCGEMRIYSRESKKPFDGVFRVCFYPFNSKAERAEYLISTTENRMLERINWKLPLSYEEPYTQSKWIVIARFRGIEKQSEIGFEHPPIACFNVTKFLKGPTPSRQLRVRYDFGENAQTVKPKAWEFNPAQMPKEDSEWVLFLTDQTEHSHGDLYKTWKGRLGRQLASENTLDAIYRVIELHRGQQSYDD